jgi:hypothetical protein
VISDKIDPNDKRIDVRAKFALQRIRDKKPHMREDALRLIRTINGGQLAGIYGDDLAAAVEVARKLGTERWLLVPKTEDAVLVLEPTSPLTTPPTIIFRGDTPDISKDPDRLDLALQKASRSFHVWQLNQLGACSGNAAPVQNIVPARFCNKTPPKPKATPTDGSTTTLGQRVLIPFWVIAHRTNDLNDVQRAMKAGANGLECDVRWDNDHFVVRHDVGILGPFDRPFDFIKWLKGVRGLARMNPRLSLVIFDYKEPEKGRVDLMLRQIRAHLTSEKDAVPISVIISVAKWNDRRALEPIFKDLAPHEGVAIDEDAPPQRTSAYFYERFRELGARNRNHAYGTGVFIGGPEGNVRKWVMNGVALKGLERRIKFVYVWTLNRPLSVAQYLWIGVDGVFVNDPQIALHVLNRPSFRARYRLAGREDRVFQSPHISTYVLTVKTGNRPNAGTDATIDFHLIGEQGHVTSTRISAHKPGLFERGSTALVTLRGKDVGRPTRLRVTHDGVGIAPDWFLETIKVQKAGDPNPHTFRFNRWIRGWSPVRHAAGLTGGERVCVCT